MMGRFSIFSGAIAALAIASPAVAAPLTVHVQDEAGRPVRDAVVQVYVPGSAPRPPALRGPYVIAQKNLKFQPFLAVIPVGAEVSFPNLDPTKHHVYSFSPAKRFELKLFARNQARSARFDKAGIVALGCNIHDSMSAFIVVTDTIWTARTDARGNAQIKDAPGGMVKVSLWHPYLRARGNALEQRLGPSQRNTRFTVKLRAPPVMPPMDY